MFTLNGQTAIVTGGASGIGLATARMLAEAWAPTWSSPIATRKRDTRSRTVMARGRIRFALCPDGRV